MNIFKDILEFIKTLTLVDYVFFFAVIMLLILIITLVYFIKSNNEVFIAQDANPQKSDDLKAIAAKLETDKPKIEITEYEKDQEDKAIISYDELVEKSKIGQISYEDETNVDGISVKKINLDDDSSEYNEDVPLTKVRVISYQNEEKFLQALKQLQSLLN